MKPLSLKQNSPGCSFEKEALKNEDQSTQHKAPKSQKQILKSLQKVDELLLTL